ncbi:MAG: hypothetical protein QM820_54170 [Minicystis sp.]
MLQKLLDEAEPHTGSAVREALAIPGRVPTPTPPGDPAALARATCDARWAETRERLRTTRNPREQALTEWVEDLTRAAATISLATEKANVLIASGAVSPEGAKVTAARTGNQGYAIESHADGPLVVDLLLPTASAEAAEIDGSRHPAVMLSADACQRVVIDAHGNQFSCPPGGALRVRIPSLQPGERMTVEAKDR